MTVLLYQAKAELFRDGPRPVRDLLSEIDVESAGRSQQLAGLRRSGLVPSIRDASLVTYALKTPDVADLLAAGRQISGAVPTDREGLLVQIQAERQDQ